MAPTGHPFLEAVGRAVDAQAQRAEGVVGAADPVPGEMGGEPCGAGRGELSAGDGGGQRLDLTRLQSELLFHVGAIEELMGPAISRAVTAMVKVGPAGPPRTGAGPTVATVELRVGCPRSRQLHRYRPGARWTGRGTVAWAASARRATVTPSTD